MSNNSLIVAGPTGVGKTAFAVELALQLDGEILGADAFQVYAGLEILTAQPGDDLRRRVPHHLIGFLEPGAPFDAAQFVRLAQEKIAEIQARGRRPILVGGSGLYLKALTHGLAALPAPQPDLRAELSALSLEELQRRLDEVDPSARHHLDFQNPRRVMRALEIFHLTGRPMAELRQEWQGKDTPGYRGLLLVRDRSELEARIAANIDEMFARGVVEEVRALGPVGPTASRAIGLREIQALLEGRIDEVSCRQAILQATRRYAKRQLTWFRNQFNFQALDLTGLPHTDLVVSSVVQAEVRAS